MNFDLSDEQRMLLDHALDFLSARCPPGRLRTVIDADDEWLPDLWKELAELGFLGVAIPEAYGGLGLGWLETGLISEAMGRVNAPVPFFSCALAADAIAAAGSNAQKLEWLPGIARGETIAVVACANGARTPQFDGAVITGVQEPVADGGIADIAVVEVQVAGRSALALVKLSAPGVTRTKLASFDELRGQYRIGFADAPAELLGEGSDTPMMARLIDRAAVLAAFEAIGGSDACLEMARTYALERRIFGRSLASYQAIKHKLADVLVGIELARSSAYFAAWAADHDRDALPRAAAAGRLMAIEAFERAARESMQVHGGIGYTFEANCHFYYRRERLLATVLGGRALWARRLIASLPPANGLLETQTDGF